MKHDPTLPIAEGWDPDNDCSRDSTETAEDGKPYRERRKFVFDFGNDVKNITGLFDHKELCNSGIASTLLGLPQTYNASYDADSGRTTFRYIGLSPSCACENGSARGLRSQ